MDTATFGAGCFWGVEHVYRKVNGVVDTAVGYEGGKTANPQYKEVCTDTTGHAEVVQVTFDPAIVSFKRLVEIFWQIHNPTEVNRQGPDVGSQYRSTIFCNSDEQFKIAEESKAELAASGKYSEPIATKIEMASTFFKAEDYHQQYLAKNGGTCHIPFDLKLD